MALEMIAVLAAWGIFSVLERFSIGYAGPVKIQHKGSRAQRFKEPFADRPLNL